MTHNALMGMLNPTHSLTVAFLPRDAMRKRGLCCRPVSIHLSVTLVHCI